MYTTRILFRLLDVVLGFVEFLIGLRVILEFFNANPNSQFVFWVYETSRPLLAPFNNMFPSPTIRGGFVIEISALFAIIVYAFIASIIEEILNQFEANELERTQRIRSK